MIGKNILLAAALCAGEMSMAIQFDGTLTDKLPGWSFKASKPKDGLVYNEFEGYYPDKGGKLSSAPIRITMPRPNANINPEIARMVLLLSRP